MTKPKPKKKAPPHKRFVFHDQDTGVISQVLVIPESMAKKNLQPGEVFTEISMDAEIDPATQRVGPDGGFVAYVAPVDSARLLREIRVERNKRLSACDWTQAPDAPIDRAAWRAYRQQLRDLMDTITDPQNVSWPISPNSEET
ncbi:tail fiber assembly protein [Pseudophaeobacter leonis]|uniref:tail fiber assembly protein n=1 Tax=Pseudophaeobacter leonis TaxID=1144477 RepID=UPI0019D34181|nr:tail fiber assembly protein [Pseudophaeobacter leonis]